MIDYENAIKKPFSDLGKLVVGILISIIPVINFLAWGFILECSSFGKTKETKKMPAWKDWSDLFIKGLVAFVVGIVYAIPALIVFSIGVGLTVTSLLTGFMGSSIPTDMLSAITGNQLTSGTLRQLFSQAWPLALPVLLTSVTIFLVGAVLVLVAYYLVPIGLVNYLKKKEISAAFDFNKIFKIALTGKYFMVWLANTVISLFVWVILNLIPLIGPAAAFFITGVITYTLYGQVLKELRI